MSNNPISQLESSLGTDKAQFIARFEPTLTAGEDYTVSIEHELALSDGSKHKLAGDTLALHVNAPQFRLDPGLITGRYPPRGRVGALGTTLPHVTFGRRTLPWERREGVAPWLALLVLHEQDGEAFRLRRGVALTELLATDLQAPALGNFDPGALGEDGEPNPGFKLDVLELSADLFSAIVPKASEADKLAHVRHAHIGDKTRATGAKTGWFPTVVANRFPEKGLNTAVLVSIEGHGEWLPPAKPNKDWVRLVALADWTFTVDPNTDPHEHPGLDLGSLLRDLDAGPLALDPAALDQPPSKAVARLLAEGRHVLPWRDRVGRRVPALYHGPLLPYRMHRRGVTEHDDDRTVQAVLDSDALLQLDRSTGLFDISLATAWQLGRLRQLADRAGAAEILAWRRAAHQKLHQQSAHVDSPVLREPAQHVERALRHWAGFDAFVRTAELPPADPELRSLFTIEEAEWQIRDQLAEREPELSPESIERIFEAVTANELLRQELDRHLGPFGHRPGRPTMLRIPGVLADQIVEIGLIAAMDAVSTLRRDFEAAAPPSPHERLTTSGFVARRRNAVPPVQPPPNREAIVARLEGLARLEGVPFAHLVPDERMLPAESIRFFETDPNWIAALLYGALAIGRSASHDRDHDQANGSAVVDDEKLVLARRDLTGFLLRSPELAGWEGLEIRGSVRDPSGERREVPIYHHRMLSDEVRLVLFADDVDLLEIRQPPEAIHFGASWKDAAYWTVPSSGEGREIAMRDPDQPERRVINVETFAGDMSSAELAKMLLSRVEAIAFPIRTPQRPV